MLNYNPLSCHPVEDRPLRILHIGNIANNAYLNARMLNEAGFDCDVLVYDYYHIMGCPEWEDADFSGPPVDEFKPHWAGVNQRGFERPRWFAQGPLKLCLRYLLARRTGTAAQADYCWNNLNRYRYWYSHPRWGKTFITGYEALRKLYRWLRLPDRTGRRLWRQAWQGPTANISSDGLATGPEVDAAAAHIERLRRCFAETFPDRPDQLQFADTDNYRWNLDVWQRLFAQYDLVHAYATDPIWPLLMNKHPYVAFEHSTIRHLPFQDSPVGRLTALSYNQADWVIITNCDTNVAAQQLKIPRYRFVPHPINEKWAHDSQGEALRQELLQELEADFLIFHPPRQHWEPHRDQSWREKNIDPSWLKGNDIFMEGLAQFMHEVAPRAGAVMVEWGKKVAESKALLAQLGIASRVKWVPPQHSCGMLRYINACDLLADQFWVGAFGSTMPKAMLIGKPAMSYVEAEMHRWCLPEMPPVISPRTPEEVFEGLKRAYQDPAWLQDIAQRGYRWYHTYHSNQVIFEALVDIYHDALGFYLKK